MTIHHAVARKAEKLGVSLSEDKDTQTVTAHWVERNVFAVGIGGWGKVAMEQMEAIQSIATKLGPDFRIKNDGDDRYTIRVYNADLSRTLDREPLVPKDALLALEQIGDKEWFTTSVPDDGAQAYKEGWTAADNPYRGQDGHDDEGDEAANEAADAWDAAFDEAADAHANGEDEEPEGGSVVKNVYRMRYAEAGHPNHCGDWLAETLNNLILGKTMTDLDNFEALCDVNGVSLAKYKRTGNGWQGRLRMTGRNLLARKVYAAGGRMVLPPSLREQAGGAEFLQADAEWMALQKFKLPKVVVQAPTQAEQAVALVGGEVITE